VPVRDWDWKRGLNGSFDTFRRIGGVGLPIDLGRNFVGEPVGLVLKVEEQRGP